jgi:hypothetical protein
MNLFRRLFSRTPRRVAGRPATFQQALAQSPDPRPNIFDPALRHFANGLRRGDPALTGQDAARFHDARHRLSLHLLRALANSPARDHLVLRGSFLLRALFGNAARDPRDLDFVVTPATLSLQDPWAVDFFNTLPRLIAACPLDPDLHLEAFNIASDEIWAYERSRGRRLLLPWRAENLPPAGLQLDFSFAEPLPVPPVRTQLSPEIDFLAATPALSLAWKLLWLYTDIEPQGKDLYDAVLLAEHATLERSLLLAVLSHGTHKEVTHLPPDLLHHPAEIAWDDFAAEYHLPADMTAASLHQRLRAALGPLLATS